MNKFMALAVEEARLGIHSGHGGPFGAVVVKGEQVIGRGHNEVLKNNDPTCHGEIMAIRDACQKLGSFDLSGSVIYTTGYPCPMCLGAILWANIDGVFYGCSIEDTEKIGFRDSKFYEMSQKENQEKFTHELDHEACRRLYDEYLADVRRKNY